MVQLPEREREREEKMFEETEQEEKCGKEVTRAIQDSVNIETMVGWASESPVWQPLCLKYRNQEIDGSGQLRYSLSLSAFRPVSEDCSKIRVTFLTFLIR